jgi:hypothetical protein
VLKAKRWMYRLCSFLPEEHEWGIARLGGNWIAGRWKLGLNDCHLTRFGTVLLRTYWGKAQI